MLIAVSAGSIGDFDDQFRKVDFGGRRLLTIMPRTAPATVGSEVNDRTSIVTYRSA